MRYDCELTACRAVLLLGDRLDHEVEEHFGSAASYGVWGNLLAAEFFVDLVW